VTSDLFSVNVGKQRSLYDIQDDELLFRVAYIPYVIGALIWDWTDSILEQAAQMKIKETTALARGIRTLKERYEDFRSNRIYDHLKEREQEHAEQFQDNYDKWFSDLYKEFREQIQYRYPRLYPQWIYFHATTYVTMVILKALFSYSVWCDREINKVLGQTENSILPDHFEKLYKLIRLYLGDDNEAIRETDLQPKVDELKQKFFDIEFTKVKA
jgi:hypothetical protein